MTRRWALALALGGATISAACALLEASCVPSLHEADPSACTYDCLGGSCLDGACQPFTVYESTTSGFFIDLGVTSGSDGDVLYAAASDGSLYGFPLAAPFGDAGNPKPLLTCKNLFQLAPSGSHLVWSCGGTRDGGGAEIGVVQHDGTTSSLLDKDATPDFAPQGVAITGQAQDRIGWVNTPFDDGGFLYAANLQTGGAGGIEVTDPTLVATLPERPGRVASCPTCITAGATSVFVGTLAAVPVFGSGEIFEVDLQQKADASVAATPLTSNQKMYEFVITPSPGAAIYGVQDNSTSASSVPLLVKEPLPNGETRTMGLRTIPGHASGIDTDGDAGLFIAATDSADKSGHILRVDMNAFGDADAAVEIATTASAADRVVYWSRRNAVFWSAHDDSTVRIYGIALAP